MLDWLSKIVPEHLHLSLNISPKFNINVVKIENDKNNKSLIMIDGDKLVINDSTKEGSEIAEKLIEELPKQLKHNDIVIEESNLQNLESIDEDILNSDYDKQLEKFRFVVPKSDIHIIEAAILISIKYKKGENVSLMKAQVVARYGARGAMICNLFSSGYFDTLILPLHKSIAEGTLAIDEYLRLYEMVVTESPLAMFIGIGSSADKTKSQLIEKMIYNQENGVSYLNIHGIGSANIRVINKLMKDDEIKNYFIEDPVISQIDKSIKVTIFIKDIEK